MKEYTNMDLQQCHNCGGMFPDEAMADWTICFHCKQQQMDEYLGEPVFIDSLGICWTEEELKEAGGRDEVMRMCAEADVRKNK